MSKEICAGIIPIQYETNDLGMPFLQGAKVYLVKLRSGNHYSFPKGHFEKGEDPFEAAKRELHEETNLTVKSLLLDRTFEESYHYKFQDREVAKTVTFFVAEVVGTPRIDPVEILEGKWVSLVDAEKHLTYPSSKKTYLEVLAALKAKYDIIPK